MMQEYSYQLLLADFRALLRRTEELKKSKDWADLVKTDDPRYIKFHEANTAKWNGLLDRKRGVVWHGNTY